MANNWQFNFRNGDVDPKPGLDNYFGVYRVGGSGPTLQKRDNCWNQLVPPVTSHGGSNSFITQLV